MRLLTKPYRWMDEEERALLVYRIGYTEGLFFCSVLSFEDVRSLASFNLSEFNSDPRQVPGVIGKTWKQLISKNALGFKNVDSLLLPGRMMLSFSEGFRRASQNVYEDMEKKQKRREYYLKQKARMRKSKRNK